MGMCMGNVYVVWKFHIQDNTSFNGWIANLYVPSAILKLLRIWLSERMSDEQQQTTVQRMEENHAGNIKMGSRRLFCNPLICIRSENGSIAGEFDAW